jgi:hypothetical protein
MASSSSSSPPENCSNKFKELLNNSIILFLTEKFKPLSTTNTPFKNLQDAMNTIPENGKWSKDTNMFKIYKRNDKDGNVCYILGKSFGIGKSRWIVGLNIYNTISLPNIFSIFILPSNTIISNIDIHTVNKFDIVLSVESDTYTCDIGDKITKSASPPLNIGDYLWAMYTICSIINIPSFNIEFDTDDVQVKCPSEPSNSIPVRLLILLNACTKSDAYTIFPLDSFGIPTSISIEFQEPSKASDEIKVLHNMYSKYTSDNTNIIKDYTKYSCTNVTTLVNDTILPDLIPELNAKMGDKSTDVTNMAIFKYKVSTPPVTVVPGVLEESLTTLPTEVEEITTGTGDGEGKAVAVGKEVEKVQVKVADGEDNEAFIGPAIPPPSTLLKSNPTVDGGGRKHRLIKTLKTHRKSKRIHGGKNKIKHKRRNTQKKNRKSKTLKKSKSTKKHKKRSKRHTKKYSIFSL